MSLNFVVSPFYCIKLKYYYINIFSHISSIFSRCLDSESKVTTAYLNVELGTKERED